MRRRLGEPPKGSLDNPLPADESFMG